MAAIFSWYERSELGNIIPQQTNLIHAYYSIEYSIDEATEVDT